VSDALSDSEDAARYRWLRDHCNSQYTAVARVPAINRPTEDLDYEIHWFGKMAARYFDQFIDAAIASATPMTATEILERNASSVAQREAK